MAHSSDEDDAQVSDSEVSSDEEASEAGMCSGPGGGSARKWKPYQNAIPECPLMHLLNLGCREVSAARYLEPLWCLRWRALWPLHRRFCATPFSWGEVIVLSLITLWVSYLSIFYGFCNKKYSSMGADMLGLLIFGTAARNSIFTLLAGVPFERGIFYHKIFGVMGVVFMMYHGFFGAKVWWTCDPDPAYGCSYAYFASGHCTETMSDPCLWSPGVKRWLNTGLATWIYQPITSLTTTIEPYCAGYGDESGGYAEGGGGEGGGEGGGGEGGGEEGGGSEGGSSQGEGGWGSSGWGDSGCGRNQSSNSSNVPGSGGGTSGGGNFSNCPNASGDSWGGDSGGGEDKEWQEDEATPGPLGWFYDLRRPTSGAILGGLWLGIALVAFYLIRRKCFEVFHRGHILLAAVSIPFTWNHITYWMKPKEAGIFGWTWYGCLLWIADTVIFYATALLGLHFAETRSAIAYTLPGDIVNICFPKGKFTYKAGQYCFLCVPELGFQWHPFSFSSSPHEDEVLVSIRVLGNWTRALQQLVNKRALKSHEDEVALRMFFDGPYGAPRVDLDGDTYKSFLLVSGGIGITPMQSIWNELLYQHNNGRPITHLRFVWAVADKALVDSVGNRVAQFSATRRGSRLLAQSQEEALGPVLPLSFQPTMQNCLCLPERAKAEFYLTRVRDEGEHELAGISPATQPHVVLGRRPDFKALLQEMKAICQEAGETHCAVLVCGPLEMVKELQKACAKHSKGGVVFDLHHEIFEF